MSSNNNNASNPPTTAPELLARFRALTFTEVRKVTCLTKTVNVIKVIIAFLSLWEIIPILGFVAWILKIIPRTLMCVFRLCDEPLRILVEAEDARGRITLLMIKDGRSLLSRLLGLNILNRMDLSYLHDRKTNLMTTKKNYVFDGCFGCCCCVPIGCCTRLKQLELKNCIDGTIQAYRPFKRCACCSPTVTHINFGDKNEEEIAFVKPKCPSIVCCGKVTEDHNTIIIGGAGPALPLEANITFVPYRFRDFLMDTSAMGLDELSGIVLEEDMEEALDALKDAKGNLVEIKENLEEFEAQGYQKIMTSDSIWKVAFPTEYSHKQKCAVMLYVIEQYRARL